MTKLSERPEFFELTPNAHPLKQGLQFAGLGRTHGTTRYHDSAPAGNHGTLTNMVPATDWVFDPELRRWCVAISGANDQVIITPHLNWPGGWTISQWLRPANYQYDKSFHAAYDADGDSLSIRDNANTGIIALEMYYSWSGAIVASNSALPTASWSHVVILRDGSTHRMWVNGVQQTATATRSGTFTYTGNMAIGGDGTSYMPGRIADFCMWNRTLSVGEIRQLGDRSDVMLGGLLVPPPRRLWAVTAAPPATTARNLIICGGVV